MEAKPHQVRVWRPVREATRLLRSSRGNEANPKKINAIRYMKPPRCKKDLMKLTECYLELVHQPARRQRPTLLQTSPEVRQVRVDRGSCCSLPIAQRFPHNSTHPHSSRRWGDSTPLHCGNHSCGQNRPGRRTGRARPHLQGTMTRLLHQ